MELYDKITNIYGINVEETIKCTIESVKKKLNNLLEERTCKIYSSYLLRALKEKHLSAHMINTKDLGLKFEHLFILIPSNEKEYYLIDLTYSQFGVNIPIMSQLLSNGYQIINDEVFRIYLKTVLKENYVDGFLLEDVFYSNDNINKLKM